MAILNEEELITAVARMKQADTDLSLYELKEAAGGFPRSALETISAFANTSGGTLIFGISESGFHAVSHLDVKRIQAAMAQAARNDVQPAIAADIRVLNFENSLVVVANIPELPAKEKPCYVKKLGRVSGSYIRTGDGDHKLSLYEIDRFIENQQRTARYDCVCVDEASVEDFDSQLLQAWLANERRTSFGRADSLDDQTIMANRRVIAQNSSGQWRPTMAGLMALGSYPQKFFPRLNVVFTSYAGAQKGIGGAGVRYSDAVNIDGPIPAMLLDTLTALSRNMKHGAIVRGGLRADVPDYPLIAVREAVANALMHRDYSPDAQGAPVLVDLYPDRLEISNPGGLYGSLTVEDLGTRGSTLSRNQFLARILESVVYIDIDGVSGHVVENRGTGFPVIRTQLQDSLMDPPIVKSSLNEFRIVFKHRKMTQDEGKLYSAKNVSAGIVDYLGVLDSASAADIAQASGLSVKTVRSYLNELIESGVVEGIGSLYSPKRRYRLNR